MIICRFFLIDGIAKSRKILWGVIPAKAGIHIFHEPFWIPACAGMTQKMPEKQYYVYILSNKRNGTLYTGITSDLIKRIWQHKNGLIEGFSKHYGIKTLVYFEAY